MKRIALSLLTAAIAAATITPIAYASPNFDQLRRDNLDKGQSNLETLQAEHLQKEETKLDRLRRENLDKDQNNLDIIRDENLTKEETKLDRLRRENLDKDQNNLDQVRGDILDR
ncbi:MAG: hypothetical protein AAFY67_10810 [Cyanobacteria bacterium J06642_9]